MNTSNFKLNSMFTQNAKEYRTMPVIAAKYSPGMETGFLVYFSNTVDNIRNPMLYEGIRIFRTQEAAKGYISANHKQYIVENGKIIETPVSYDEPQPVLHRRLDSTGKRYGVDFDFGRRAFLSDESGDYDFFILGDDCWIIEEPGSGNIRVWHPEFEEPFFGKGYISKNLCSKKNCDIMQGAI